MANKKKAAKEQHANDQPAAQASGSAEFSESNRKVVVQLQLFVATWTLEYFHSTV